MFLPLKKYKDYCNAKNLNGNNK